jgi:DNA repair protein RadC
MFMEGAELREEDTRGLLTRLKSELPEIWSKAQVVGSWVWLEFSIAPAAEVRTGLKRLGFHWNGKRKCWQHPCGHHRPRSTKNPKTMYQVLPASAIEVNDKEMEVSKATKEYKVVSLREIPLPESLHMCDTPQKAAEYWRQAIATNPYFNPECECFAVIMLNTRRKVKGHQLISIGILDTILVHPREVFRGAIVAAAAAVVIMHNHPSGEPQPSEADIKITRDLIRAGQLIKIEVLDHVVMGNPDHCSLREMGYFYA